MTLFFLLSCSPGGSPPAAPPAPSPAPAEAPHTHAPGDHAHASPHGGMVQTVGDMHVEALMMAGGVMFYLSDGQQKPLAVDGYSGSAVVKGPGGLTTVDLAPMGDHLHAAAALEQGKPASVVLTLKHGDQAMSASFETQAVGLATHDHTSLHGGTVSMWGNYHVEYAPKDASYRIWVTDESRNPVSGPITASVKDGDRTVPLAADPTGMLSGPGEGAGTRPVMVDVKVGDAAFSLSFNAVP